MSLAPAQDRLQLPETLRDQLLDFRRRVWSIKMIEAVAAAIFGLLVAFLRDVPRRPGVGDARGDAGCCSSSRPGSGLALVPAGVLPLDLAKSPAGASWRRLLGRKHPQIGDQLLGDHRAGPQRCGAGAVAGPVRGRHPSGGRGRAAGATSGPPCPTLGTGSGAGWWAFPGPRFPWPAGCSVPTRPPTPGGGCSLPGATRPATPSRPSSRCPARWSSRTASRSRSRRGSERRRPGGRARAWCSSASNIPSPPRSGTGSTSSSSRRRSIPAGSRSASATRCSGSGSSRRCVPS